MNLKKVTLKGFVSFYAPYKALLVATLLCSALSAMLSLLLPICVRYITKDILEVGVDDVIGAVIPVVALMLIIIVFQTCFGVFQDYKGHDLGAKIERDMRQQLFDHYQELSFSFFDNNKTGQLMSRLTNDLLNLAELYHHGPENIVIYGTQFIGALVILLCLNYRLALLVCVFLPIMAAYSFVFYRKLQRSYALNLEQIGNVNGYVEENLSGIRVVKSFTNEMVEINKFRAENNRFYEGRRDIYKKEALHYTVMDSFFANLITVTIVAGGAIWIAQGSLSIPDLIMFIMYSAFLIGPIPKLAFMVQQYQEGISGYRRFREIIDTAPDIKDDTNAHDLTIKNGRVEFRDVSFKYSDEQEYVLKNISFNAEAGDTVAIVGVSGIGKTTLCSLIPRFYDVSGGDILIDGICLRSITQSSLRRHIGVVSQDNFLFSGTIMENILYGRPSASEADAIEAATLANAHDFITQLPKGYYTEIGERGVKLSGGQKQRLSIARVFLKNPPILIFDEATSALDYESERAVMESLQDLAKGRTTFIIAHRLSKVQNSDHIIVLSDDGIAEIGTHEKLLSSGGIYSRLYNMQIMK